MKRNYVFEWLDQLITVTLPSELATIDAPNESIVNGYMARVKEETTLIHSLLKKEAFCTKNEKKLELRVDQYQSTLIRLLDQVYQLSRNSPTCLQSLCTTLKESLEHLLRHIEQHFSRYFNQDQCIPLTYWQICKKQLYSKSRSCLELLPAEPDLAGIVMQVLQQILNKKEAITYRQKFYVETLFEQMALLERERGEDDPFSPLGELLIYLNFNHAEIISALVKQLEARIGEQPAAEEKAAMLHYLKKRVRQLPLKPGFQLFPDLPPVQTFLLEWIQFEIDYLQSQSQPSNMQMQHHMDEKEPKIQLSVSVAMLGLFVRLLTEEGIITNKNQSELVRFFATHFATSRQSDISSDSLYGSYFKPQPGTVRMMKECLLRMQGTLHKKF